MVSRVSMKETLKILTGESIQLEPLVNNHGEQLRVAANNERIWSYMPMKAHGKYFDDWFSDCLKKHSEEFQLTYAIRRLSDNKIVGSRSYYITFG